MYSEDNDYLEFDDDMMEFDEMEDKMPPMPMYEDNEMAKNVRINTGGRNYNKDNRGPNWNNPNMNDRGPNWNNPNWNDQGPNWNNQIPNINNRPNRPKRRPPINYNPIYPITPNDSPQRPMSAPPSIIPQQNASLYRIDSGQMNMCLYRNTYVWLKNGASFWFYPVQIGRTSVSGFRWMRNGWAYTGFDLRLVESFVCNRF